MTNEPTEHYLSDEAYDRLITELLRVDQLPVDRASWIKINLGEIANVWPESVRPDEAEAA
ncbi:hypothetical protein C5F48_19200 [Cereibacter changlensis JA139]|uniref:Uncharacterized protein n=2 Tax=Cereibacter changlensis TaxID=402884 RepID=A0A2T4JQU5_9RHOB|nr:hypothetical protein [Cereibacter changlensis]PTE20123.1 hypothetical protein C5F48_19200 [Cereibacter changlensis JA139]PZX52810.1 hypothetical protein LX76_02440 [Cereibacter changlensis]